MLRQIVKETLVVTAGTALLLILAATWGLPGDETASQSAAAGPLLMSGPPMDVDPAPAIMEGRRK